MAWRRTGGMLLPPSSIGYHLSTPPHGVVTRMIRPLVM